MPILRRGDTSSGGLQAAAPRPFAIVRSEHDPLTSVIAVEGDLDLSTAPRLKWTLLDALDAGATQIVLDLSEASFMDSTALGVLLGASRRRGLRRLAIVCTRAELLRIFEFSGAEEALPIFSAREQAIAHVQGRAETEPGAKAERDSGGGAGGAADDR